MMLINRITINSLQFIGLQLTSLQLQHYNNLWLICLSSWVGNRIGVMIGICKYLIIMCLYFYTQIHGSEYRPRKWIVMHANYCNGVIVMQDIPDSVDSLPE